MALSALDDPNTSPSESAVTKVLGRAAPVWASVTEESIRKHHLDEVWTFAGAKFGWSLRLTRGKRVIVYLTPSHGHFLASFALGEKACETARAEGLPARVLELIEQAPRYAEGRGVRIPVETARQAIGIAALVAIKLGK